MNALFKVESGLQLLARLTRRPNLDCLWQNLHVENLPAGSVVEIVGSSGSGKSVLVADIIFNTILPPKYGGCGAAVVIINTDGNINFAWIASNIQNKVCALEEEESKTEDQIKEIMENLHIANIYDSAQLLIFLEKLELMITDHPNISLVVFDTLTAFYWSDQVVKIQKMDLYLKNLLKKVQKITKEHKVTMLYTKPQYFGSKHDGADQLECCVKEVTIERINSRIFISSIEDSGENKFQVTLNTSSKTITRHFKIVENSLLWLKI